MDPVDLNLLVALDALLAEGSVTGAARRLGLSPSAMSRTLTRLRSATGDPLLVRAGRRLVPTSHAAALRDRVSAVAQEARAVLRPPASRLDLATLATTFTIRANEAFVAFFAVPLLGAVAAEAPGVRLRFAPKPDKNAGPIRDGRVDLEIGVVETTAPEMRAQFLFRDRLVGVVRRDHPRLGRGAVTTDAFAACRHVVASPRAEIASPVDDALAVLGLARDVAIVVPGFPDAMRVARATDLVAVVPRSCLGNVLAGDEAARLDLRSFDLPVRTPEFLISALWHPRVDADPAHRWLRTLVRSLCRVAYPSA